MNKKGFTTLEVVLSFVIVSVILVSLTNLVVNYRDKTSDEYVNSQLWDLKNTITKVVYDDITLNKYQKIEYCSGTDNCFNFIDKDGNSHALKLFIDKDGNSSETRKKGMFIYYKDINDKESYYMIPDSDLNVYSNSSDTNPTENYVVYVSNFSLKKDDDLGVYSLKLIIEHTRMKKTYEVNLILS